jgi:hypothetical protein
VSDYDLYHLPSTPYNNPGNIHPLVWKFFEPNIQYGDSYGTQQQPLFRVSEAYLIAAEAIIEGGHNGQLGDASVYYNIVVDRALGTNSGSTSYRATPGNLTIDMILNERARELMGENVRWYDLKRTQTLISRAKAMNPWTKMAGKIDEHDYLRPIPQSEIDLATTTIKQNGGY